MDAIPRKPDSRCLPTLIQLPRRTCSARCASSITNFLSLLLHLSRICVRKSAEGARRRWWCGVQGGGGGQVV